MEKLTVLFKALSDRNRLRVVAALARHHELCACQLTELLQVTGATSSRHMGVLIAAGVVTSRKEGRWVYYQLCREPAETSLLLDWLTTRLENDPAALLDAEALAAITARDPEELCRKQRGEKSCPPPKP